MAELKKALIKEFCSEGDKTGTIPETTSSRSNAFSFRDGFPIATATPQRDGGIPPKRTDMNKILNMLSINQSFLQNGGVYFFDEDIANAIGGYPKGAILSWNSSDGNTYRILSLVDNNITNPVEGVTLYSSENKVVVKEIVAALPIDFSDYNLYDRVAVFYAREPRLYEYRKVVGVDVWQQLKVLSLGDLVITQDGNYFRAETRYFIELDATYKWLLISPTQKNNIISPSGINNLRDGEKDIVYQTQKPTMIICGHPVAAYGWNFKLEVSVDGNNWTTINYYAVNTGDPRSTTIMNTVIAGGLRWRFRCTRNGYVLKYAEL